MVWSVCGAGAEREDRNGASSMKGLLEQRCG